MDFPLSPPWASLPPQFLSSVSLASTLFSDHSLFRTLLQVCRAAVREARVWGREEPSATGRCWEITSRVSRSQPSGGWHAEAEWSVSAVWSTRKLAACWRSFLRTWSAMPWHTPSTPDARLWLPWTLCMPWSDRDVLYTVSAVRGRLAKKSIKKWCSWTPPLSLSFVILELALWWGLRSSYGACTLTWAFVALVIHRYRLRFQGSDWLGLWPARHCISSVLFMCLVGVIVEVLWVLWFRSRDCDLRTAGQRSEFIGVTLGICDHSMCALSLALEWRLKFYSWLSAAPAHVICEYAASFFAYICSLQWPSIVRTPLRPVMWMYCLPSVEFVCLHVRGISHFYKCRLPMPGK